MYDQALSGLICEAPFACEVHFWRKAGHNKTRIIQETKSVKDSHSSSNRQIISLIFGVKGAQEISEGAYGKSRLGKLVLRSVPVRCESAIVCGRCRAKT